MDKLTLRELSAYLPYNVMTNKGLLFSIFCNDTAIIKMKNGLELYSGNISELKLVLHPLSDLTKPCLIQYNIPIILLAKFVDSGHNMIYSKIKQYADSITVYTDYTDVENVTFKIVNNKIRAIYRNDENVFYSTYLKIQQKLLEWNFDVFNLIGRKLAIDINTI